MKAICTAVGAVAGLLLAASQASAAPSAPAKPDTRPAPVSDADLGKMSGGQDTVPIPVSVVLTNQTATNSDNVVSAGGNVGSGDVNLGQDAFQGFAGIGNFVINTGHNNNLLGSLSVSISMTPTGTP